MLKYIKYVITIFILSITLNVHAQLGYDFSKLDLGLAGNANIVFGDAETIKVTPSGSLSLSYNPASPFINYIAEFQLGRLAAGDSVNNKSGRQFKNDYTAYILRAQVQAGEFYDYSHSQVGNFLKNVYVSAGVGLVNNNITEVSRTSEQLASYYSDGKDKSTEFFIPVRAGYELKIFDSYNTPSVKIDLAYQVNFMMGDNLDGFDAGARRDIWGQFSLGVKFAIGSHTSYRKPVSFY